MKDHNKTMIRSFKKTDLKALHYMICETIDASYTGVYPPRAVAFFKEYHSKKKILERSAIGEILVLTNDSDNAILATGSLAGSEATGVFVRPEFQGQGHGKSIMAALERIAVNRGIKELTLSISLPSRQFYERLGYRVIDEHFIDVGEGEYLKYWSGKKDLNKHQTPDAAKVSVDVVKTSEDAEAIDELLWRVLWKPLGLPRNIRKDFAVEGREIELAAIKNECVIGGIVGVITSGNEAELRHLAVHTESQGQGIGKKLVEEFIRIITESGCRRIHTIARNTSAGFFRKLGFETASGIPPDHPMFRTHGITFELMDKSLGSS